MISILLVGLLAFQQVSTPPVGTQLVTRADSILEARTKEVAAHLRCPVCQGLSLQDSPSPLAQEMRSVVKEQLRAGKSEKEVKAYFVAKYSEWILLEPPAHGFNLAVYLLPAALLLGGAGLIVHLARKWSRNSGSRPPRTAEEEEELEPEFR